MNLQRHIPVMGMRLAGEVRRQYWKKYTPDTFGAKSVIHDDNNVLLVRNQYGNPDDWTKPNETWDFPGGGLDDLNKLEARALLAAGVVLDNFSPDISRSTARKELFEEVGYNADPEAMHHIGNVFTEELSRDRIGLFAIPVANLASIEFVRQRNEIYEIKVFPMDELPDNKRDYIASVVGQLLQAA